MDGTQRACSTGELANEISSRCGGTPGSVRAMHHSHSTPAGVDGGGARTPPATPKKAGKMLAVRVQMLDDTITMFQIQAKALGRVLFDQVCKQLHLLEADYFGLEYQDLAGTRYWLELQKAVSRQLGLSLVDPLLRFCVKFYTPDPGQLEEEFTRYLFCLQVKRDLAQGHLQCNDNTAALMASYIVQAECGDYVAEDYPDHTYLSSYKFVPHQDHELECRIMENHKKHAGQSPAEADLNLLETARRCELYGMKMHPAKDHEGVALNLAVAHMGIIVFQHFSKINTFSWAKIRKISFKRKRFLIKLHPEGYGYYKDLVEFFFEGRNECKNFWKKCVEHHGFFRCSVVKNVARHKTRVLSRGSSFRYSGKTQKQMVEFVRDNYVKRQTFQRSASFRHSAHSSVANVHAVSVGNSISAHPLLPLADPALAEELDRESRKASAGWAASRTTREAYRLRGTATRSPHSSITPPDSPAGTPATTSSPSPPPTTRSVSVEICTSTSRAAAAATSTLDAPASDVLVNTTTTTTAASSGQTSTVPRIIPRTRSKVTTARARPSDRYLPRSEGSLTEAARSRRLSDAPRTSSEGASDDGEADDRRSSPSPPARDVSRFDYETYTMRTPVPRPLVPRRSASCRELYDFAFDDTASKESSERRATSRGSGDVNSVHIDERKLESPVTRYDDSNRALYCTTNRNVELDIRQDIIVLNHKIYSSSYPGTVTLSQESMEDPGNYELGESQDDLSHDSYELLERSDDDASAPGGAYRYRHSFPNDKTRSGSLDSGNYVQSVTTDSDSDDALRYKSTSDVHYDIFAMDDPRDFPREKNPRRSDGTFYKTVKLSSRTSSLESKSDYYDSIGSAGCGSGKKLSKGFSSGSRTSSLDSKSDRENKPTLDKSFVESVPRSKALSPPPAMDVPKTTPVESPTYVCPSRAHDDKIGSLFEFKPAAPYRSSKTKEFTDAAFDGFLNFKETTHVHSVSLQNVETEQNIRNNRIADPELNTLPRAQRSSHKSVDSYPKSQQTTTHIWPESIHGLPTEIPDRIFERNDETKSAPVDRPATRSDSNIFSFDDDKIRELKDSDFIDGLRSDSYPYPPLPILDSIDFSLETSLNDYTAPAPTSPINGTLAIVDEPPSAPKVSDPLPIPILPPSYATHPPIERTKSDPNTACDRQRLGSNSRRHTLMHQKSIDLTPAESSDEDYVYRQIPSAPPLSKSAASRFEMPTAEFGHFDVLQRDIEGQKTKFEVPKSQFEVLGAKTQFDLINLPPKDDFDIPYILHKRHVMNGTAPRTSDIKKETVVKSESTDKHKPCRRSSQEMSPKAPKSPKSGEYKTIEKSLSATSTERQPSSFLFTQNVDLSNINPITLEVDKNDLPVHRSNSPKRDITKIDPTVLEALNLKLSRIESDSPPMTERTVTIDRTKLETKPPHKQKYDNDVVIATKPVRGNAKDKPKRTIKARTPLSKKAQAKAKGKIRITSFSSDDESLNSDDVFGSAEATPTKLEFSPPQPRKEMESILKFESERQSHLQYAMSSTEIEGSPPQPRKTETLPFDRSLEPGHSELRRISERSISIPSSEEDFRPPERQSCTEPISEATLSSALELPTVVDVNDVFIDPSPIETLIPSIVEPESTDLKSAQSPEEKICVVDKTETTTSDSVNADKLPPKIVAAEIKQSSLEKPTITSRKEFPTTRVEKTPKAKKADTKFIIPKQTVSMKSGDVKDKTTSVKVDSVKEAKLKSFLADSDPVLRRGQPPGLFAHARLNLSEGSGFTALQRQIAVQSPSSTRKTKSLDTAVVSVTSLPPPNAFSCKDDTVDSTEGIDDESDSEQADDIDKKVMDFDSDVIEDKDQIVPEIVSQQVSVRSDNEEIQISVSLPSDEIPVTKQSEKDEEIPKIRESPPSSSAPEDSNLERTLSTDEKEKQLKPLDSMADANLTPQKSISPNTDKKPPKALTKDRSLEKQKSPKSKTPSGLKTSKSQESEPSKRVATKEKSKSFEKLELKRIGSKERSRSQDDNEASSAKRIEKQQMLYETAIKQTKTLKSPVKETLPPFPIVEDSVSVSDGKLEIKIDVANFTIPDDAIIITKSPKKLDKKLTKSLELNFPADPFGVDEKQVFRLGKSLDLERERKRDAESESKPEFSVEAGGDTSEETSDIESETCDEIIPTSNDELIVSEEKRAIEAVSCLLENSEHPISIDVHEPFSPDHEKVTPTKFEEKPVSSKPELPPKPIPESTDALSTRRNLSSIRLKPVPRITSEDESLTEVSEMKSLLLKKMADERSKSEDTTSWVTVECDETIGEEESSESVPLATEDKNRLGAETISNKNKLLKFSDTRSRSSDTTGSWTSGEKDVSPGNQSKDTKSGDESSASCAIVRTFGISQHIEKYESREQLEKEIESRPISTEQLASNNTQELIVDKGPRSPLKRTSPVDDESSSGGSGNGHPLAPITTQPVASKDIPIISGVKKTLRSTKTDSKSSTDTSSLASFETAETKAAKSKYPFEQKWLSETELRGQLKITGKSSASDRSGHSSFDESEKRNGSLDKPRIQSLDKLSTESKNSIDTESSSGSLGAAARMQKTGEAPTQEASSTWRPFLIESSGSSSLEDGILPPDYDFEDKEYFLGAEAYRLKEDAEDICALDNSIGDIPAHFAYPALTSTIASIGATETLPSFNTGGFLARTLSRISERSSNSEKSSLEENSSKRSTRYDSTNDESIVSSDRPPSLSSDTPSDEKADAAGIVNGCRVSEEPSDALHEKQTRNTSRSHSSAEKSAPGSDKNSSGEKVKPPSLIGAHLQRQISDDRRTSAEMADISFDDVELIMSDGRLDRQNSDDTVVEENPDDDAAHHSLRASSSQESEDWPLPDIPVVSEKKMTGVVDSPPPDEHFRPRPREDSIDEASSESCAFIIPDVLRRVPKVFCLRESFSLRSEDSGQWPSPPSSVTFDPPYVGSVETYYMRPEEACKVIVADSSLDLTPEIENETFVTIERTTIDSAAEAFFVTKEESASTSSSDTAKTSSSSSDLVDAAILLDTKYSSCEDIAMEQREEHLTDARTAEKSRVRHSSSSSDSGDEEPSSIDNTTVKSTGHSLSDCSNTLNTVVFQNMSASLSTSKSFKIGQKDEDSSLFDNLSLSEWSSSTGSGHLLGGPGSPTVETIPEERTEDNASKTFTKSTERPVKIPSSASSERRSFDTVTKSSGSRSRTSGAQRSAQRRTRAYATLRKSVSCDESPSPPPPRDVDKVTDCPNFNTVPLVRSRRIHKVVEPKRSRIATATSTLDLVRTVERDARPRVVYRTPGRARKARSRRGRGDGSDDSRSRGSDTGN